MPVRFIRQKVVDLRQQPEHIRIRAAALLTAASGTVIGLLWITILLPLQIALTTGDDTPAAPVASLPSPSPVSAVAGIRQQLLASPSPSSAPSPSFAPVSTPVPLVPSPTPTTAPLLPVSQ